MSELTPQEPLLTDLLSKQSSLKLTPEEEAEFRLLDTELRNAQLQAANIQLRFELLLRGIETRLGVKLGRTHSLLRDGTIAPLEVSKDTNSLG